jgi:hypothetical protein
MLSKLNRAIYGPIESNGNVDIWPKIDEYIASSGRSHTGIVQISTHIGFTTINEKEYFIKTPHYSPFINLSLVKEYLILKQLYTWLEIELLDLSVVGNKPQFVLIIEKLDKLDRSLNIDEIELIISETSSKFDIEEYLVKSKSYADSNISIFLNPLDLFSEYALGFSVELNSAGLLHDDVLKETLNIIDDVAKYTKGRTLCHGDLHLNNLYQKRGEVVILDWEDAFLGSQIYDICMWATFIKNRNYIPKVLNRYVGASGVMTLIIIIKSYIGFLNEDHKNFKISINDRINEVIRL